MTFAYKKSILIVDDEPSTILILANLLKLHEYEVRQAANGQMALEMAHCDPPDLILLDIIMPQMDGYEVCRQLKSDPVTCKIPVLFITALSETEEGVF